MFTPDLKLISLFIIITASLLLRISVEQTGYCSPDSWYYLEAAQNIRDGNGFYHSNQYPIPAIKTPENQVYFAVWPLGYPLLIAGFATVFHLSVFWASKMINIFFLGWCFLLFRKIDKEKAYLLSLIMCSFTFLEVFSYTWSEGPFVFGMLWFGYYFSSFLQNPPNSKNLIHLFLSSAFLFLIRYIGGFSFIFLGLAGGTFLIKKQYKVAAQLLLITLLLGGLAGLYFYNNFLHTGYLTGGERFYPEKESLGLFCWYLFVGLFNEFFIIRNYYWHGAFPDLLFWLTAGFQIFLMVLVYLKYLKGRLKITQQDKVAVLYFALGVFYLLVLIIIRFFSPFDPFDYRLLAPFSICVYTALLLYLIHPNRSAAVTGSYKYVVLFFIISLILNLPKEYLLQTVKSLIF